jgi:hypothetical protein
MYLHTPGERGVKEDPQKKHQDHAGQAFDIIHH